MLLSVGALLIFSLIKSEFTSTQRVYTDAEFNALVIGKTETEVVAALGPPYVSDTEPWNSPQANKRCLGYAYPETRNPAWRVAGRSGGVGIFFATKSKRADHIEYFPAPQQQNGRLIIIRW